MKKVSIDQIKSAIKVLEILNEIPHEKRIALDPRLNYSHYNYSLEALNAILERMKKESARVSRAQDKRRYRY